METNYVKPEFKSIFLNMTDACNLRCRYCFVEKNPHFMTYQIAQDAIDLLIDINRELYDKTKQSCSVQLFGGEPTLMWDSIIVPLIQHCKDIGALNTRIKFGITTNGILLDEEKMNFLEDNQISVLFSIDGTKETQDFNRPCVDCTKSSFDILEPKIPIIAKRFHPTFRGTLLPETCHNLYDNIMYAAGFEFTNCFFIPDWSNKGWTKEKMDIIAQEVRKYSLYFIDCYRKGLTPFEMNSYTRQFEKFGAYFQYLKTGEVFPRNCSFCGLGTGSAGVAYDGSIYACQELPSIGTRDNPYYIGDIYHGIDINKRAKLINEYINNVPKCEIEGKCESCVFKSICPNNTCHASCWMRSGDLNERSEIECFWEELTMKECLWVAKVLAANDNQAFINKYHINKKDILNEYDN